MRVRRNVPKTGRAKALVVANTHGRAKTLPEDKSGEGMRRRKDKWVCKDTSRRQVGQDTLCREDKWALEDSSQRQVGRRRGVAKTRRRAKTLPEDRSGEHTHRREDTCTGDTLCNDTSSDDSRARKRQGALKCMDVFLAARCMQMRATCCSPWHSYNIVTFEYLRQVCPQPTSTRQTQHLVASSRVQTWRCLLTWRQLPRWCQGAMWCRRMWRQNVASHVHVASPDAALKRGVRQKASPAHAASGRHVASLRVALERGVTCPGGVREPRGAAGRGVRTRRQLLTWRE